MYDILRGKSGGVILKCKACSHAERVNEFDDRLGSRRTRRKPCSITPAMGTEKSQRAGLWPRLSNCELEKGTMTILWAILYSTFHLALMLNGWCSFTIYAHGMA